MNDKENNVMKGFLGLSISERENLIKEITRYQNSDFRQRENIRIEVERRSSVGPKNTICTCCGK